MYFVYSLNMFMALYIDPNFKKIVFCMVDDIDSYATEEIKVITYM